MYLLTWLLRAFLFFVLFAFAMNNGHEVQLKWFFGFEWRAPMVLIVLTIFAVGCGLGALAMLPSWWRLRRCVREMEARGDVAALGRAQPAAPSAKIKTKGAAEAARPPTLEHPPRDGL
jgi:uncharacterized integral membrane protein